MKKNSRVPRILGIVIASLFVLFGTSACGYEKSAPDQIGLHYDGGPFAGVGFKGIIKPASKKWFGPGDKVYFYPIGQRTYDSTGDNGAESGPVTSTSKDSVEMSTPISITFSLKTDADSIRAFHEKVGIKYQAYMDGDKTSDGWKRLLAFYIGQSIETTLDREIANYNWRDLYNKPEIRLALQDAVNKDLPTLVKQKIQGDYFDNFSAQVQKPDPTNDDLKKSIADAQNNIAAAQAAQAKAQADLATAKAQIALQQAEAAKKKADISAYGSVEEYNKAQCIQAGCNPYQPTYVVNGTTPSQTK